MQLAGFARQMRAVLRYQRGISVLPIQLDSRSSSDVDLLDWSCPASLYRQPCTSSTLEQSSPFSRATTPPTSSSVELISIAQRSTTGTTPSTITTPCRMAPNVFLLSQNYIQSCCQMEHSSMRQHATFLGTAYKREEVLGSYSHASSLHRSCSRW